MSHQVTRRVRVGDLSLEERAQYGLTDHNDNDLANIVVANVVKDEPKAEEPKKIELKAGERVEPIK